MSRPECDPSENILRSIRSSDWDKNNERYSSNLFTGPNTSVGRLGILPKEELFTIFCGELHKPPVHRVLKGGELQVGRLIDLGKSFISNKKPDPRKITVEEDPVKDDPVLLDNPAHAEIVQKLPRGLAFDIIEELKMHKAPYCSFLDLMDSGIVPYFVILFIVLMVATFL